MKKEELANRVARSRRLSPSKAADLVDRIVADLIRELRKGRSVDFPGLGTLHPARSAPPPLPKSRTAGKKP
jgi:nucleoid DNA-binding protein